jgi:hypothetical protein
MSKAFLTDINLSKNELQNARIQNLASAPSTPVEGQVYYDTTTDKFGVFNGATWDYMGIGDGAGTVTSVAVSGSDGIEVDSGSPITSSGTIALGVNKTSLLSHINVEDGADVTDATNVDNAGAVMNSDESTAGMSFVIDENNMASDSDTKVPTQQSVKAYVDASVVGLLDFKGSIDASENPNYPSALKGDTYVISVAGKVGGASGIVVEVGDMIIAVDDNAGGTQASVGSDWSLLQHNLVGALLASNNLSDVANAATAFGNIKQAATDSATGVVELATQAEAQAKSSSSVVTTPASLADFTRKYTGLIGDGEETSLAVTHGLGTQFVTAQVFDESTDEQVECDIVLTSDTQTTFTFAVAPTEDQYRVVIVG